MVKVIFNTKDHKTLIIVLKRGNEVIGQESLTVSQEFDNMLIKALDKLVSDNKIDRLSIKNVEISGKMEASALSSMVLSAVKGALGA